LLILVLVGKMLDVSGNFRRPSACEALTLMWAAFTRETGLRQRPVMVT